MNRERLTYLWKYYPNQREEEVWGLIDNVLNKRDKDNMKNVLEIGVELGGSSVFWKDFCMSNGGFYIGLDIEPNRRLKEVDLAYPDLEIYYVDGDSTKKETILEVKELIDAKGKVDFLFLDGDHASETVYLDVVNYYPFLKEGGVFAFHDYLEPPVQEAVDILKRDNIISYSSDGLFATEYSKSVDNMGIYYFIKE